MVARAFGVALAFNEAASKLAIRNSEHELKILTLPAGTDGDAMTFPSRVVPVGFDKAGKRLAVITADQKLYTMTAP